MAGLQRSAVSFRRQGSSGFVWDDKFLSGELNKLADQQKEDYKNKKSQHLKTAGDNAAATTAENSSGIGGPTIDRSRSNGGRGYRNGRVSPALEPPSPRVSACGLCGAFGNSNKSRRRPPRSGKRVMWFRRKMVKYGAVILWPTWQSEDHGFSFFSFSLFFFKKLKLCSSVVF